MSTPLLGLALPADGTTNWGTLANTSITALLDSAVAGTTTLSTDADVTLTDTAEVANQARQAILLCSGARTALRTITAPAQSKAYIVVNNTSGGYGVKVVGAGPTTGVTVAAAQAAMIAWNGSDFALIATTDASKLTGVLAITSGGTGQATAQAAINALAGAVTSGSYLRGNGTNVVMSAIQAGDLPTATDSVNGAIKLGSSTIQSVAANAVTATAARTYAMQLNSSGQAVVNVPWTASTGGGTVTSVGLQMPGEFTVTNSPVTGSGTLTAAWGNQAANYVLAAPNGTSGTPSFRLLVAADIPTNININGTVGAATPNTGAFTRLRSGVGTVTAAANIVANSDAVNQYNVTALNVSASIDPPSGTPANGQKLIFRIKDNGVSQALTWNAIFRPIGITLPTSTAPGKTMYIGCVYNSDDAYWDAVAFSLQA